MRISAGTDPDMIANRVAFIEKTPRLRISPYTVKDDFENWREGPKGCSPEYGQYQPSRDWCDNELRKMNFEFE